MSQLKFSLLTQIDDANAVGIEAGYGFVYKVNHITGQARYVGCFEGDNIESHSLVSKGCVFDKSIFWAPNTARYLWSMDLDSELFRSYQLPDAIANKKFFYNVISYGGCLYFFSRKGLDTLKFDPRTETFSIIKDERYSNINFKAGFRIDGIYYACVQDGNLFFEFDLENEQYIAHELPKEFRGASCPCLFAKQIWVAPRYQGDPFLIWNIDDGDYKLIDNPFEKDKKDDRISYVYCKCSNNKIIAISVRNDKSVIIDPMKKEFSCFNGLVISDDQKLGIYGILNSSIILGVSDKNKTYYYDEVTLYKLDFHNNTIKEFSFFDEDTTLTDRKIMKCFEKNDFIVENKRVGLSAFLNYL